MGNSQTKYLGYHADDYFSDRDHGYHADDESQQDLENPHNISNIPDLKDDIKDDLKDDIKDDLKDDIKKRISTLEYHIAPLVNDIADHINSRSHNIDQLCEFFDEEYNHHVNRNIWIMIRRRLMSGLYH